VRLLDLAVGQGVRLALDLIEERQGRQRAVGVERDDFDAARAPHAVRQAHRVAHGDPGAIRHDPDRERRRHRRLRLLRRRGGGRRWCGAHRDILRARRWKKRTRGTS
jgi:hypothetical protein